MVTLRLDLTTAKNCNRVLKSVKPVGAAHSAADVEDDNMKVKQYLLVREVHREWCYDHYTTVVKRVLVCVPIPDCGECGKEVDVDDVTIEIITVDADTAAGYNDHRTKREIL